MMWPAVRREQLYDVACSWKGAAVIVYVIYIYVYIYLLTCSTKKIVIQNNFCRLDYFKHVVFHIYCIYIYSMT